MKLIPIRVRFTDVRSHIITKNKTPRKHLSPQEISKRKRESLKGRKENFAKSPEYNAYIAWMFEILKNYGLYSTKIKFIQGEDDKAGDLLGISGQMVRLYRIKSGHFPSKKTHQKLIELERVKETLEIVEIKVVRRIVKHV